MGSYISYYTYMVSKSQRFTKYLVGYDRSVDPPEPIYQYDVVQEETMVDGDATQIVARGLEPNTAYYIKLKACNRAGCTYKILGPIVTWKVGEESTVLNVNYRQNPLTGLLRVWWDSPIVPDFTELVFSQVSGGSGSVITSVEKQTYLDSFRLAPGTYDLSIESYMGSEGTRTSCGRGTINGIVIKQFSIGLVCEDIIGLEAVIFSSATKEIEFTESFTITDSLDHKARTPFEINVHSGFSIVDSTEITISTIPTPPEPPELEYVYIEVESRFNVKDSIIRRLLTYTYIDQTSTFTVTDSFDRSNPGISLVAVTSAFTVTDKPFTSSATQILPAEETFTVIDSSNPVLGAVYHVIDSAPLNDSHIIKTGDWHEYTEAVTIRDIPHQPPLAETIGVESLGIYDTAYTIQPKRKDLQLIDNFDGSEVGQTYDFSHLNKGDS